MNKTTNNYVVVTKTKVIGYCVEIRDADNLRKNGRSRAIFDIKSGEMVNIGGVKNTITLKEYCKVFAANKTATIVSYHVFGTKGTNSCDVCYNGKRLHSITANDYESSLVKQAIIWAKSNGFTHYKIVYN